MDEYTKINTIWKRDDRGQILDGEFATPELDYLSRSEWRWTEKVDGTNIRLSIIDLGGSATLRVGGRTDNAQVPTKLVDALQALVSPEAMVEVFTDGWAEATLYGEGYGAGVQKGGNYRPDLSFVLFDVKVGPWWLRPVDVSDVATKLRLDVVPLVLTGDLFAAHHAVKSGELRSRWNSSLEPEGLVGRPLVDLFDRKGDRVMAKIKARDFARLKVPA